MMDIKNKEMQGDVQCDKGEIVLYQPNESIRLEVKIDSDAGTVWLSQAQMSVLYGTHRQAITKHIKNIYSVGELESSLTSSTLELVQKEGKRLVKRNVEFYNLDVIISVGYRVNTRQGIQFRRWATEVLREHLLSGYSINRQLIAFQERTDERFVDFQQQLDVQKEQVSFLVDLHRQPTEALFSTGCVWDAWAFLSSLIRSARQRIILIDNYVDERTLLLLDKRQKGVSCIVHTRFSQQTELDFEKHNRQNAPIEEVQLSHKVHDRYLIIDDTVWLLGASVKDMGRGLCTVIEVDFTPDDILEKVK